MHLKCLSAARHSQILQLFKMRQRRVFLLNLMPRYRKILQYGCNFQHVEQLHGLLWEVPCAYVPRGAQVLLITWVLEWLFFVLFCCLVGARPYLNLLQHCASAMGRLGAEAGRSLEQPSPRVSLVQCEAQSCYALVEVGVGRKPLKHGVDPKPLTQPCSHAVLHGLEIGPVSEGMELSAVPYTPEMSHQMLAADAGLATADPRTIVLVLVTSFPLHLHVRTSQYQVPQLWLLCLTPYVPLTRTQRGSALAGRDSPPFRITQDSWPWRNTASKQPWGELAQLEESQAAGTPVLSQTEGSPSPYPASGQPGADAQQKSTRAGQAQRYFLHFILPVSGNLEFRNFLSQGSIFISAV